MGTAGRGSTPGAKGVTKRLDKFVQVSTPLPVKPIAIQYPWVFSDHAMRVASRRLRPTKNKTRFFGTTFAADVGAQHI